jgi:sirohydrochlorin ferrochelatase
MPDQTTIKGVIILGHGSRLQSGLEVVTQTAERFAARHPDWHIEPAFLQFARPTVQDAARVMNEAGISNVTVVPLFLSMGAHCIKDLPGLCRQVMEAYPGLHCRLADPIGADPLLCDIVEKRLQAVDEKKPGK